jgi:hypothetical protein
MMPPKRDLNTATTGASLEEGLFAVCGSLVLEVPLLISVEDPIVVLKGTASPSEEWTTRPCAVVKGFRK